MERIISGNWNPNVPFASHTAEADTPSVIAKFLTFTQKAGDFSFHRVVNPSIKETFFSSITI